MDIYEAITNRLDDNCLGVLGAAIGVREAKLRDGVSVAVPAILRSIRSVSRTKEGCESLWREFRDTDPTLVESFQSQLHYCNSESLVEQGNQQLLGLLGSKSQSLVLEVSRQSDVGSTAARKLIGAVTPLVYATLAQQQREKGLNVDQLQSLLDEQGRHTTGKLTGTMEQLTGFASPASRNLTDFQFGATSGERQYSAKPTNIKSDFTAPPTGSYTKPKHEFDYKPVNRDKAKTAPRVADSERAKFVKRATATGATSVTAAALATTGLAAKQKQKQGLEEQKSATEGVEYDLRSKERRSRKPFAADPSEVNYAINPKSKTYQRLTQPKSGRQSGAFKHNPIAGFSASSGANNLRQSASDVGNVGAETSSGFLADDKHHNPGSQSGGGDFNLTRPVDARPGTHSSTYVTRQSDNLYSKQADSGSCQPVIAAPDLSFANSSSIGAIDASSLTTNIAGFTAKTESVSADASRSFTADTGRHVTSESLQSASSSVSARDANASETQSVRSTAAIGVASLTSTAPQQTRNDSRYLDRANLDSEIPEGSAIAPITEEPGLAWLWWPIVALCLIFGLIAAMKALGTPAANRPASSTPATALTGKIKIPVIVSNLDEEAKGSIRAATDRADRETADKGATTEADEYRKATGDLKAGILFKRLQALNESVTSTFSAKKKGADLNSEITRLEKLNDLQTTWTKKTQIRYQRKLKSMLARFDEIFGVKLQDDRIKSVLGETYERFKAALEDGTADKKDYL